MRLTCKEATRLASQRLDREFRLGEGLALRLHLAICGGCASAARQMAFLRKAVARLAERSEGA